MKRGFAPIVFLLLFGLVAASRAAVEVRPFGENKGGDSDGFFPLDQDAPAAGTLEFDGSLASPSDVNPGFASPQTFDIFGYENVDTQFDTSPSQQLEASLDYDLTIFVTELGSPADTADDVELGTIDIGGTGQGISNLVNFVSTSITDVNTTVFVNGSTTNLFSSSTGEARFALRDGNDFLNFRIFDPTDIPQRNPNGLSVEVFRTDNERSGFPVIEAAQQSVPEPASLTLVLGVGGLATVFARFRKR